MPPSLYANLLNKKANPAANASSPAVISSEPVKYSFKKSEDELKEEKKAADAALRFQPVKRPQVQQQKAKPRGIPASSSPDKQLPPTERKAPPAAPAPAAVGGDSIENWIDEDADDYYVAEYTRHKEEQKERQREDKKRRKKKNNQHETREVNWNSLYEPDQPIRLEDYRGSLEELDAKYEWKQRLHAHQRKKNKAEARASSQQKQEVKPPAFAPPANYNFAPPPLQDSSLPTQAFNRVPPPTTLSDRRADLDEDDDYEPPPAVANVPAAIGDASYVPANHGPHAQAHPPPAAAPLFIPPSAPAQHLPGLAYPPPPAQGMPLPPGPWQIPPGGVPPPLPGMGFPIPPPGMPFPPPPQFLAAQAAAQHSSLGSPAPLTFTPPAAPTPHPPAQPSSTAATISRAPVRFTQPPPEPAEDETPVGGLGFTGASASASEAPSDNDQDDDQPRSRAPGQKGFAKRLLQKYGWKEGQGLGADNSGITTILQHQTQKRKKKADAEGGGWAGTAAMGRIVGGKKRKIEGEEEDGSDGKWSIVARFEGMLSGMDIDHEIGEGDLMQRMGERMAEYGVVERLYIHRTGDASPVFVKFTSALSAYRAVQASQGKDFLGNGRVVKSGFWDEDKFANDVYE